MPDGGHIVARILKQEKTDTVFTLCDGHIMPIYNGFIDEGIRIVHIDAEAKAAVSANSMVM